MLQHDEFCNYKMTAAGRAFKNHHQKQIVRDQPFQDVSEDYKEYSDESVDTIAE